MIITRPAGYKYTWRLEIFTDAPTLKRGSTDNVVALHRWFIYYIPKVRKTQLTILTSFKLLPFPFRSTINLQISTQRVTSAFHKHAWSMHNSIENKTQFQVQQPFFLIIFILFHAMRCSQSMISTCLRRIFFLLSFSVWSIFA